MRAALLLIALLTEVLCPHQACAWDAGGHEIVAAIADARLNPKARQELDTLARGLVTPGPAYDSITIANWMDDLRRKDLALPEHGLYFTWHYIDLGIEAGDPTPSFEPGDDNEFRGNIVQALKRATVVLQGGTDPYVKTKPEACALIMHLVGDIHQPLHAATHYFVTAGGWRHHDAGGNKEYVLNGPGQDSHFNLHRFWDCAWRASFDDSTGNVVLDSSFDNPPFDRAALEKAALEISQPATPNSDLEPAFEKWALESHALAQNFVYREITATSSKKNCRLSRSYVSRARSISRQRLYLAGCRLATLLNETLGAAAVRAAPPPYPAGPGASSYESGM